MSPGRARLALWTAAVLLLPLPYLVLPVGGAEPVVRFLFLGAIAAAYSSCVDGSGVAWLLTGLLLGHVLLYSAGLGLAAWLLVRAIPAPLRRPCVLALGLGGAAVALAFPIYRTPFDDVSAWSRWLGLFQ